MRTHRALIAAVLLTGAAGGCAERKEIVRREPGPDDRVDDPDELLGKPLRLFWGDLNVRTGDSLEALALQRTRRTVSSACDFAARCAELDFIAVVDDAEDLPALVWTEHQEEIARCNEQLGPEKPGDVDAQLAAFLGFTWNGPAGWGRKAVVFRNLAVTDKPIGAPLAPEQIGPLAHGLSPWPAFGEAAAKLLPANDEHTLGAHYADRVRILADTACPEGDIAPRTGPGCRDQVATPGQLFERLRALKADRRYGPRGYDVLAIALGGTGRGPRGEATDWSRALTTEHFAPDIQRLGEVYSGLGSSERDDASFRPAFGAAAGAGGGLQALLSAPLRNGKAGPPPRMGVVAGTATTRAWPGYTAPTDHAAEPWPEEVRALLGDTDLLPAAGQATRLPEHQFPGGVVGVWAQARTRRAIWRALRRREVFATSGPRIELEVEGHTAAGSARMGGELEARRDETPRFTVRALGAPRSPWQQGGECHAVCNGMCYVAGPDAPRHELTKVEVVRLRFFAPGARPSGEACGGPELEDPWRTIPNEGGGPKLELSFEDPSLKDCAALTGAAYYVRVLQEPTEAATAAGLSSQPQQERAWSSPIWVDY